MTCEPAAPHQVFDDLWKQTIQEGGLPAPPTPSWVEGFLAVSGPLPGKRALEAGSGSGTFSAALAQCGAGCVLLDLSPAAMAMAHQVFQQQGLTGAFVQADLFTLPFKPESFDIVWNSGVLEHFPPELTARALAEMARVSHKDGTIIVLVPSARGMFYRLGKYLLEKRGRWAVGYERPIFSFRGHEPPGWQVVSEFQVGVISQLAFLPHKLQPVLFRIMNFLCRRDDRHPLWEKIVGGYLLVSQLKYLG